ncbi:type I toxin-antitoxin system Hok family toxin [Salmonella enterica]|nr:type I toxin-antitoxin system Hok family toxin [Salmonella enterica]
MEPQKLALLALIVVGAVCLGALLLGNKNLCDVSFRSGKTEIVAHMAYDPGKSYGGGEIPRHSLRCGV